jgi:hypothetical protein
MAENALRELTATADDLDLLLVSGWYYIGSLKKPGVWLLCARQVAAEESPVYCLQREGPYSLAWGLLGVWERCWRLARPVDWAQVVEPEWKKVRDRSVA